MSEAQRIEFGAGDGVELVGELRVPDGAGPFPAVALTGPLSSVKEQVVGTYARLLTGRGLVTLAFDHRGFGESSGRRQHEDTQGKLADLRAATTLLAGRPEVDPRRIGVVGICLGGGYAVRAGATDPRVRAVAGIAGAYNSPAHFSAGMGIDSYRAALAGFLDRYDEYLPAVAADGEAAMPGSEPYSYYGTTDPAATRWRNELTTGSLHALMTFDALGAAELLGATPLLVVHGVGDDYCSPALARELHDRAPGPKEIRWLDTTVHIDLYDQEPYVTDAAATTATFLLHHLS